MIVLDTHALVWWVSGSGRLSARAKRAIEQALRKGPAVASTITVLEIATAVRRGRLELGSTLDQWLAGSYAEWTSGDPADRIIMATASTLGAKLVTADERLRQSSQPLVVW